MMIPTDALENIDWDSFKDLWPHWVQVEMYCSLLPSHYHVEFLYLCAYFFQEGMEESEIADTLMEQFLTFLRVKNRQNGDLEELVEEHHAEARFFEKVQRLTKKLLEGENLRQDELSCLQSGLHQEIIRGE
jgi:hypothetical protein